VKTLPGSTLDSFEKYVIARQNMPKNVTERLSEAQQISMRDNNAMMLDILNWIKKQERTIVRLRNKVKKITAQRHGYSV
jgi:hypothetical protein